MAETFRSCLSNAIREALLSKAPNPKDGEFAEYTFFHELTGRCSPPLNRFSFIEDEQLNAAFQYASIYFFHWGHGDWDMNHLPWEEATRLLESIIDDLGSGSEITDPRILRYGKYYLREPS